jgi:hypothetical protein
MSHLLTGKTLEQIDRQRKLTASHNCLRNAVQEVHRKRRNVFQGEGAKLALKWNFGEDSNFRENFGGVMR